MQTGASTGDIISHAVAHNGTQSQTGASNEDLVSHAVAHYLTQSQTVASLGDIARCCTQSQIISLVLIKRKDKETKGFAGLSMASQCLCDFSQVKRE